jgi:MFS family permease
MLQSSSIESRESWVVASAALCTMAMAMGSAWITAVALKDIASEIGGARSVPALASALAWLGSGAGGILMGRIADRIGSARATPRVLSWRPNSVFALMCTAAVLCCIPMAMPQGHLVAFCSDLGISRAAGALMLSVLLGAAFISRQIWGAISDRIGGLSTVLIGSAWQAAAMTSFLLTQDEFGLFTVAAAFGLGFSGIIPAYVLALRELFPASQASWRIPTLLLFSGLGMAAGGWLAGLRYDHFGYYAPALLIVGGLVARKRYQAAFV